MIAETNHRRLAHQQGDKHIQQDNDASSSRLSPTNQGENKSFHLYMKWCSNNHLEDGSSRSHASMYSTPDHKDTSGWVEHLSTIGHHPGRQGVVHDTVWI